MRGKITLRVSVENGAQPMTIELESNDWSHGDNPRYIPKEFAEGAAELAAKIEAHLVQEYGDIRDRLTP